MTDPKEFLQQLHKNLNILEERRAKWGGNEPLELVNQIEDHQKAIGLTEQWLAGDLSRAAWREALRPLLVNIRERTSEAAGVTMGDVGGDIVNSIIAGRDVYITYQSGPTPPTEADILAAAQERLAEMPLDHVPDPTPLPTPHRMLMGPLTPTSSVEKTISKTWPGRSKAKEPQPPSARSRRRRAWAASARRSWPPPSPTATASTSLAASFGSASPSRPPCRRK